MGTQQRGSRCAPRGMFPRVSPRPRSERAMRRGGLPSHGAEPFPSRVWVRRGSLTPRNITRGESGGYGAHRASPIPGFFYISLPHTVGENCSEAAPSRTRTACNAAGHSEQPPRCPPRIPLPRAHRGLVGRAALGADPCAAAGTIGAPSVTPTDLRGESRTFRWAL